MKEFKILIVEDERQMSMFIEMELKHEGYTALAVYNGLDAIKKIEMQQFDLIILDIMLPGLNGLEVCKRIRRFSQIPIIMLTAKSEIKDKVNGLDIGGNDYITKPFAIEELLARIRVIQRNKEVETEEMRLKDLVIDLKMHKVMRGNRVIELTKKEFDLLEILLINKNIVMTREQIIDKVWGFDFEGDTNVVDVFIRYLRSKIDDDFENKIISTVRGVGYVIKGED